MMSLCFLSIRKISKILGNWLLLHFTKPSTEWNNLQATE